MKRSLLVILSAAVSSSAWAQPATKIVAPPPVSGRTLANPDAITSADVLARVRLIQDNLQHIRLFMGRPSPPKPLLRVEGAHAREVYLQTYNLVRRSRQLGFEHLRTPQEALAPAKADIVPALNLELLNEVVVTVLRVKRKLGIETVVAEAPQDASTTPTDVFNTIIATGRLMDSLLDTETNDEDVFIVTTFVFNIAAELHARSTKRFIPDEPAFEPNLTSGDVYAVLYRCFDLTAQLAKQNDLQMLRYTVTDEQIKNATTNNASELAVLLIAELVHIYRHLLKKEPVFQPYYSGRKYPSHAVQRALHLELILKSLVGAGSR